MNKTSVDILIVALNKIDYDGRLFNFLHTFSKNNFSIATITIGYPFNFKNNLKAFTISIDESSKTIFKTINFTLNGLKLINSINPTHIICSDVYSLPLCSIFKKRYKSKLYYDSREIYSSLASLSNQSWKQKLLTAFEKHYIKFVDKIIVTGELDKEYLSELFPEKKFSIIKNYPSKCNKTEKINLKEVLKIPENSILAVYQGVLLNGRGLDLAIKSLSSNTRLHLVVIGSGPLEAQYKKLAQDFNVSDRTHFLGLIQYSQLLNYTMACDIGLCLIEPISFSYELALPNKLFEYLQAGIPTIATKLPAIESVFLQYKVGELVPLSITPKELARKIEYVFENKYDYQIDIKRGSETFCWESQEDTILGLLL
ncbi:MAG: glycosyltransferase [Ignavibacteria bacterium]|nr:glycosyltransferase [Ignavibacteria bacterium]